ncbi:hypothetical protein EG68_03285 [Paragonimus skrjabini miyazakii]|uniref:CCHC-type domain-containing protein n=1 Tax=Paragonimus skrjabini miyazakii TaxID=59628 RepID=A0A8S9YW01_9TREM|nr:hypothetical protein EG68_03285 [Paragonimus skrjabini miyazakii]
MLQQNAIPALEQPGLLGYAWFQQMNSKTCSVDLDSVANSSTQDAPKLPQSVPLGPLKRNCSFEEVEEYLEDFETWCEKYNVVSDTKKKEVLIKTMGNIAQKTLRAQLYNHSPMLLTYSRLKSLIWDKLTPEVNSTTQARMLLHLLFRKNGQTIGGFIEELKRKARNCQFGIDLNDQQRDCLIAGINEKSLQRQLLALSKPSFETVCKLCLKFEENHSKDVMVLKNLSSPEDDEHRRTTREPCKCCGGLHAASTCMFRFAKCFDCGQLGHMQMVCQNPLSVPVDKLIGVQLRIFTCHNCNFNITSYRYLILDGSFEKYFHKRGTEYRLLLFSQIHTSTFGRDHDVDVFAQWFPDYTASTFRCIKCDINVGWSFRSQKRRLWPARFWALHFNSFEIDEKQSSPSISNSD